MGINEQEENAVELDESASTYLTFWIDDQLYSMAIANVVQIIGMCEITAIPEFPFYAKGIISIREEIVPIIDVRLRFNKEQQEYTYRTCIIVTKVRGKSFGFVVDAVDRVTDIPEDSISKPPTVGAEGAGQYLVGVAKINDRLILMLETAKLLGEQEFDSMAQIAAGISL